MERIRSRTAFALGGAGRVRGGGLIALLAAVLLAGVGCTGGRVWRMKDVLPPGWVPSEPATAVVAVFAPNVQHLPDPSHDGEMRPGLVGQMLLLSASGQYADADGSLYVMAEDATPRPPGQPPQVAEVWHFDPVALRKLRTKDERLGDCYALFLPYPSNWKDVTQVRLSTRYEPTREDRATNPVLTGQPQTLMLDFSLPGQPVWLDKSGPAATAPAQVRAIPNVSKALASGGLGKPFEGPSGVPPLTPQGTVQTGGQQYPNGPQPPAPLPPVGSPGLPAGTNPSNPFPPGGTPPQVNAPPLPPPTEFSPDRPKTTALGPNGEKLNISAVALPPGQSVPEGWERRPDGSIMPAGVQAQPQTQQPQGGRWTGGQTGTLPPSSGFQPASERFRPASERYPASQGQTQTFPQAGQSRIQHGAFNPPQQPQQPQQLPAIPPQQPLQPQLPPAQSGWVGGQPLSSQPTTGPSAPLPALPPTALPGNRPADPTLPAIPPVQGGGVNLPPVPQGGGVNLPPANFDPNSPVGAWANQPQPAILPPPPPGGGVPTVLPPVSTDGPLPTRVIQR